MDKLERVARALCGIDGHSPDEAVDTGKRISRGFLGSEAESEPRWHRYRDEARRFAAAYDAMRTGESETSVSDG